MLNVSKTVTFEFRDGTTKTFRLDEGIHGLRDSKGRRPIKAILSFAKNTILTKVEIESLYCTIVKALDPIIGEVVYDD